ncbi:PPPDE putative peptidase domain-containing protein [Pavlovales sp. CCMP2436]|nr:PPPDE putative peptidase domain-containing protein [Pavlovales sp. CCMP2436]
MASDGERVVLRVYDLTRGMASKIIGRPVEGIWHSGVVVFGREIFFGSGIQQCSMHAFPAMYGMQPTRSIDLGPTEVPAEMLEMWLAEMGSSLFRPESYHLLQHNCNHFADEMVQFMTGGRVPTDITSQADELMRLLLISPMAAMVLPALTSMGGPLGNLIPNVDLSELMTPRGGPAGGGVAGVAAPPPPTPPPAQLLPPMQPPTPPPVLLVLRTLGDKARPLLSLQASATAIGNLLKAAAAGVPGCSLTDGERAALERALPTLLARAAAIDPAAVWGPVPSAHNTQLNADERAAVLALARAAAEWPAAKLSSVAFVVRSLVLLPDASVLLVEQRGVASLVKRAGAAENALVRMMVMTALSNALAVPASARALFADAELTEMAQVDSGWRYDKQADLSAPTLERARGEYALRLLRALGQLLVRGGPDLLGLARALGHGEHTAELAAADPNLHADLRELLRE